MSFLEIKDLSFSYGKVPVLKNINATIPEQATTALIGASGSGKSTLLRCINRIFELYRQHNVSGDILLNGHNLLDKRVNINVLRKKIGMVFQKPTPFPMSIFENIAFALRLHEKLNKKEMHERVEEALKRAALWDEVKDDLHKAGAYLSGGQQQRLCIARTIALRPDILLLDEPTSALDPISTSKIEELVLKLKKEFTIIMVTHHLQQARRLSDQVIFMHDGRIVESGDNHSFFSAPQEKLTQEYLKYQSEE
ncbi:MAG: phosphate ABC transporter ATP-binding protein PstB [Pseudomonadota bacterium]